MDSLTQFVLGAAVGEAVLGKKMGNRAMLWGGIAGTIPDLDVLGNLFMEEFTALAFHRAITHSLFFAVLFPFVIGWLVHKLYTTEFYKNIWYRRIGAFASFGFLLLVGLGFNVVFYTFGQSINIIAVGISLMSLAFIFYRIWTRYLTSNAEEVSATYFDWVGLFFVAIVTHPLLDCCTTYGTQLYQPFIDYRVAWNTVSVVDPVYTIPFLACLLIASFLLKANKWRRYIIWAGIIWSTSYLVLGYINKQTVNRAFGKALDESGFQYSRYMSSPTILNGILWYCAAEGDSSYMIGYYSLLDKSDKADGLLEIPKNHHLISKFSDKKQIQTLKWFTNDYFAIIPTSDSTMIFSDLRFRMYRKDDNITNYSPMSYNINISEGFDINAIPKDRERISGMFSDFWERMKGH